MKLAAAEIVKLDGSSIAKIVDGGSVTIDVDGQSVDLNSETIVVERKEKSDLKVTNDGTLTVALETKITDELKKEGYVRDLIRGIQSLRKESGFDVTDRINLTVFGDDELKSAYEMFSDMISSETLASTSVWSNDAKTEIESEDKKWSISVVKA